MSTTESARRTSHETRLLSKLETHVGSFDQYKVAIDTIFQPYNHKRDPRPQHPFTNIQSMLGNVARFTETAYREHIHERFDYYNGKTYGEYAKIESDKLSAAADQYMDDPRTKMYSVPVGSGLSNTVFGYFEDQSTDKLIADAKNTARYVGKETSQAFVTEAIKIEQTALQKCYTANQQLLDLGKTKSEIRSMTYTDPFSRYAQSEIMNGLRFQEQAEKLTALGRRHSEIFAGTFMGQQRYDKAKGQELSNEATKLFEKIFQLAGDEGLRQTFATIESKTYHGLKADIDRLGSEVAQKGADYLKTLDELDQLVLKYEDLKARMSEAKARAFDTQTTDNRQTRQTHSTNPGGFNQNPDSTHKQHTGPKDPFYQALDDLANQLLGNFNPFGHTRHGHTSNHNETTRQQKIDLSPDSPGFYETAPIGTIVSMINTSNEDQLRKIRKDAAFALHPDRKKDDEFDQKLRQINEAIERRSREL